MSKKPTDASAKKLAKAKLEVIDQLLLDIDVLKAEVTANKARMELIVDGLVFVADQSRVQYGLAGIALAFDAVNKKLAE